MDKKEIATGVAHSMPKDLEKTLAASLKVRDVWNGLTPLARNEWICWVTIVKKPETRKEHIERLQEDLLKGKRRPCCWIGCIHRTDKAISPSIQGMLNKRNTKSLRMK